MFRNYLQTAIRNIVRQKLYSFINIAGLAMGLACAIFIILFVRDELSFDKWVPDSGDVYQLDQTLMLPGRPPLAFAATSFPLAALLKDNLPEVTAMTRFWPQNKTLTVNGRAFAQSLAEVDTNFFDVIRFPLLQGTPTTALSRPDSIVLSQTLAKKLFGNDYPLGLTVTVNKANCKVETVSCANETVPLRVTAIMRDLPHNTHMRAEAIIPHNSLADNIGSANKTIWFNINGYSYVKLAHASNALAVERKIGPLLDRHIDMMEEMGVRMAASKAMRVRFVRFANVHLDTESAIGNMAPPGSRTVLVGLTLIGSIILLIACFNFTNLATARSLSRAREIALRKCVGARRSQLITQFLGESILIAMIALLFALAIVEMALPLSSQFLNRPITFHYASDRGLLGLFLGVALTAGLISGVYPALVLSRFHPAQTLRSSGSGEIGLSLLRSSLVVVQFASAIGLSVVTLVVFAQINFARDQNLGFRHSNILVFNTNRRMDVGARDSFVASLRKHPGVLDVAQSSDVPFSDSSNIAPIRVPGRSEAVTMEKLMITPELIQLYGMTLVAGRSLTDTKGEDRAVTGMASSENEGRNILINQAAAVQLGLTPFQALNRIVMFGRSHVRIVGVLRDAHIDGARGAARPTIYLNDRQDAPFISVRVKNGLVTELTNFTDRNWRRFAPGVAINRSLLDDSFQKLFQDDKKQGQMFGLFVGITILISCLGLFGLAALTAERRTREIGIRKVYGARTRDIVFLMLWQFSIPVLIANLVAWPIAWYYLQSWLQGFSYRISLSPFYFITAGGVALVIAWVTVVGHAFYVARANPIFALRHE